MSRAAFLQFHNEVLNLPRDSFSNFNILKVKSLAEYLYSIRYSFPHDGLKIKDIYIEIHYFLQSNNVPNPNNDFIQLFDLSLTSIEDINTNYATGSGRKFRHWIELAGLLEILSNVTQGERSSKRVLTTFTEEIYLIPTGLIPSLVRDRILSINTISKPGIGNLSSYSLFQNLDFRPAMAILKYIFLKKRICSRFELSIFFGRPNYNLNTETQIIDEAILTTVAFPINQIQQIELFFQSKDWLNPDGSIYEYAASQQPYFKFNAFFVLLVTVGLINYCEENGALSVVPTNYLKLTPFANSLFATGSSPEEIELENLLDEIEDEVDNNDLASIITRNRTTIIQDQMDNDTSFIERVNTRAAAKSGVNTSTSTVIRWRRDELVREVSKLKVNHSCQSCNRETFLDRNGNNFVESHHILEYNSTEDGPDVLQNLLVLCPNCHSQTSTFKGKNSKKHKKVHAWLEDGNIEVVT